MLDPEFFRRKYDGTCSINSLKPNCVTFVRSYDYLKKLINNTNMLIGVIAPTSINDRSFDHIPDNNRLYFTEDVDYDFTLIHNSFQNKENNYYISKKAKIHPTVIFDVDGIKVATSSDGSKIQFVHTGDVQICDDVEIGPYTVIHRGTLDTTIIRVGVKIGAHCNIGHNNDIGANTVIAAGVMLSGSIKIGENCWLGTGSSYRNGITICDNVVVGVGSVVIKDILKPGVYAGNPARFLRELNGIKGWDS